MLVKIRKSDDVRLRNLPVIVMTTANDNVDRNLAFLNGANDEGKSSFASQGTSE